MKRLGVLISMIFWVAAANAGELRFLSDGSEDLCHYRFEGRIAKGDAAKLDAIPTSAGTKTVCFDSPGGDFVEARAMFDALWAGNLRSTVLPGERCEGACVLAFLGGSAQRGAGQDRSGMRELHLGGTVGVHSPGFPVQRGQSFSARDVEVGMQKVARATQALQDVRLTRRNGLQGMTGYLFDRFLRTPSTAMFQIDRVGRAVMADLQIFGVAYPGPFSKRHALSVCDLAYLQSRPLARDGVSIEKSLRAMQRDAGKVVQGTSHLDRVQVVSHNGAQATLVRGYPAAAHQSELLCRIDLPVGEKFAGYAGIHDYRKQAQDRGFDVAFVVVPRLQSRDFRRFDTGQLDAPNFRTFVPFYAIYGAETRLEDLPRQIEVVTSRRADLPRLNFAEPQELPRARFTRLESIDLVGADLTTRGFRPVSLSACERICRETDGCRAYTWVRDKEWCFPKSGDDGRKINDGMVSGVRR